MARHAAAHAGRSGAPQTRNSGFLGPPSDAKRRLPLLPHVLRRSAQASTVRSGRGLPFWE
jgi:hypothetical protein